MYCVYLTIYSGNKLPPFYIGSTSIKKINSGYRGSVTSKKYAYTFMKELKHNPHLFKTKIISLCETRKDSLIRENQIQHMLNVVQSPLYINQAFASANGFFGYDNSGYLGGFFGKKHSEETLTKMRKPKSTTSNYHKPKSAKHRANMSKNNAMHSLENRKKVAQSKLGRKSLYKDGYPRKCVHPHSDAWNNLLSQGYLPKN